MLLEPKEELVPDAPEDTEEVVDLSEQLEDPDPTEDPLAVPEVPQPEEKPEIDTDANFDVVEEKKEEPKKAGRKKK